MRLAGRLTRGQGVAVVLVILALLSATWVPAPAGAAVLGEGSVTLSVIDVTPSSPPPSETPQTVTVRFRVRNNTADALSGIVVSGQRATPIDGQKALDDAMAHPSEPDAALVATIDTGTVTVDVPAGGTTDAVFTTVMEIPPNDGICECANAIYPLYFTATIQSGGNTVVLGTTQTYIPSFDHTQLTKVQVGWIWPLLDVPHRVASSTIFRDDSLAAEISPGGRLDRALTVLENVAPTVSMTVLTDPDLLDELEVMAQGTYQVEHAGAPSTPGTGSGVAAAWLARLHTVLTEHPTTELDLTPYGDPDVEGLARNGLSWFTTIPAAEQVRITAALGGVVPHTDLEWPLNETLSKATLAGLVREGIDKVVLGGNTLPGVFDSTTTGNAVATVSSVPGAVAGVLNPSIEAWAAKVFAPNGSGAGYLAQLVAQVALHAVTSVDQSHFVLVTPPRLLDVDPAGATRAIEDVSTAPWSTPVTLRDALKDVPATVAGSLKVQPGPSLPSSAVDTQRYVSYLLRVLPSMFLAGDREAQIGSIPVANQLAASSSLILTNASASYAAQLRAAMSDLREGVRLIVPHPGSYTLTSTNSSIPVTVANELAVAVQVNITAEAVGGVAGFAATPIQSKVISPRSTVQLRLPIHFDRPGRIQVQIQLATPNQLGLGEPIQVSVRSTALGAVGVIITVVAAIVLVLALIARAIRRMHARSTAKSGARS